MKGKSKANICASKPKDKKGFKILSFSRITGTWNVSCYYINHGACYFE